MEPELLRVFREGRPLDSIGPFERVGPDAFPLAANSPLRAEHEALGPMLAEIGNDHNSKARPNPIWRAATATDVAGRTRWLLALLERTIAHDAGFSTAEGYAFSSFFNYGTGAHTMAAGSIILSKVFLLADAAGITDKTIVRQIKS